MYNNLEMRRGNDNGNRDLLNLNTNDEMTIIVDDSLEIIILFSV